MKKILASVLVLLFCTGITAAQDFQDEEILKQMGVSRATMDQLRELNLKAMETVRLAGAEQKILQARLERMLLNRDPDMNQVEALLRESLEWKLKVEMRNIERTMAMRRLLGEDQWMQFLRYRNEYRQRTSTRAGDIPSGREPVENRNSRSTRNSGDSSGSGSSSGSSGSSGRP